MGVKGDLANFVLFGKDFQMPKHTNTVAFTVLPGEMDRVINEYILQTKGNTNDSKHHHGHGVSGKTGYTTSATGRLELPEALKIGVIMILLPIIGSLIAFIF